MFTSIGAYIGYRTLNNLNAQGIEPAVRKGQALDLIAGVALLAIGIIGSYYGWSSGSLLIGLGVGYCLTTMIWYLAAKVGIKHGQSAEKKEQSRKINNEVKDVFKVIAALALTGGILCLSAGSQMGISQDLAMGIFGAGSASVCSILLMHIINKILQDKIKKNKI